MKRKSKKPNVFHLVLPPEPSKRWYQKFWAKTVALLGIVSLIIGIVSQLPTVKDMFLTQREKHIQANFLQGNLRMPQVNYERIYEDPELLSPNTAAGPKMKGILIPGLQQMEQLTVIAGTFIRVINVKDLYGKNGINLDSIITFQYPITSINPFLLYAEGDRIFIDAKFVQLDNTCLGWIEKNRWYLYKSKVPWYRDDDENLEVKDQNQNIMFSAHYDSKTKYFEIAGYFNCIDEVYVLSNDGLYNTPWLTYKKYVPEWLESAKRKIASIKPTF